MSQAVLESGLRKATQRLVPILLLMYVLAFLDRTNLGFAHDAFRHDTGLSEAAYALGASLFFAGYAVLEIPSNLVLARVGARRWLARIMITWGLVSAAMMFARSEAVFYGLRFLLGVCEAGFFPGVIWYLTRWYPPRRRAGVMGLFYFGAPLSFILGGPLSGWLLQMGGATGLAGWQWLFLVEGLLASGVGLLALFVLSDTPDTASWLSAPERNAVAEAAGSASVHESPHDIAAALAKPRAWHSGLVYGLIQMAVYGVVFFLPGQIAALTGRKVGLEVGLISAAPWSVALIVTWLVPRWCDRHGHRRTAAVGLLVSCAIGMAGSVLAPMPILAVAALAVAASGFIAVQPLFWSLAAEHLTGVRAAAAIALINTLGAIGAFVAPNLRTLADAGWHHAGAGLLVLAGLTLATAGLTAALRSEQKT